MSDATAVEDDRLGALWDALDRMNTKWFKLAFYAFLLIWMVAILVVAWEWSWRDKLVPYIAGIPTILLLAAKLFKVAQPDLYDAIVPDLDFGDGGGGSGDSETADLEQALSDVKDADADPARSRRDRIAYSVRLMAWSLALPLLMYTIGFANALVLFVVAFGLRFYGSIRQTVIVTLVFSAFMYVFFWEIIGLNPWKGIFELPSIVTLLGLG
jgi:hypothetical protein